MSAASKLRAEPAVATGASVAVAIAAIIGLLKAFGVEITDAQAAAILAVVAAAAPFITGLLIRPQVTAGGEHRKSD